MRIEPDIKLDFSDILLKPKRSTIGSRADVSILREFKFLHSDFEWTGVPIISSNMTSVTTPEVAKIMRKHHMLSCKPKSFNWPKLDDSIIASLGLKENMDKQEGTFQWICLDVPNGYVEAVIEKTKELRFWYPWAVIVVGNVVTAEQTEALILAGADIVKVGIGSGALCSTRLKTGVGYPQLSAVIECADAAHGLGGLIISDGGHVVPGDICKSFAGGADFVMLGSMLGGCLENGTELYGMSSERANREFSGGLKDYRASEGWEVKVPSKGSIETVLQDIEGGLRSCLTYCGARKLKDLPKCATFILVNNQANQSLWEYRA